MLCLRFRLPLLHGLPVGDAVVSSSRIAGLPFCVVAAHTLVIFPTNFPRTFSTFSCLCALKDLSLKKKKKKRISGPLKN